MALMERRARYKSVGVAGVVSKQGRCLCRRVSVLGEADAYVEGERAGSLMESEGWFPSDDDRGQVVDGRVKG